MMNRNFGLGLICALSLFFSCGEKKTQGPGQGGGNGQKSGPLPVEAMLIKGETISNAIEVTGTILPNEVTEIRPEISGRLVLLNLREGNIVRKGDLLAKIFDGDLQAQLKKLKVQLQIANKTEERQRELLRINGISQQDYDLSLLAVNNLQADIELTEVNISRTEIRAPYAGRVGLKRISPGAYISPANVLSTISEMDRLRVEFSIPEKYSSEVIPGLDVRFSVEGSDKIYNAVISARESSVDETTRNLTLRADIRDEDKFLVPGSFAKVRIILGKDENAIMIPTQSVIPVARGKQIVVLNGGQVEFRNIRTGVRDSARVQVLEGLMAGDTLITTGLMFLRPDSKVKVSRLQ
jgi:membrane fusion protein (multidrug efflux system)